MKGLKSAPSRLSLLKMRHFLCHRRAVGEALRRKPVLSRNPRMIRGTRLSKTPLGLDKLYEDDHKTAGAIANLSRCYAYEPTPDQSNSLVRPQVARSTPQHRCTTTSSELLVDKIYYSSVRKCYPSRYNATFSRRAMTLRGDRSILIPHLQFPNITRAPCPTSVRLLRVPPFANILCMLYVCSPTSGTPRSFCPPPSMTRIWPLIATSLIV